MSSISVDVAGERLTTNGRHRNSTILRVVSYNFKFTCRVFVLYYSFVLSMSVTRYYVRRVELVNLKVLRSRLEFSVYNIYCNRSLDV